jgi:AcrR family transcriptional regulator
MIYYYFGSKGLYRAVLEKAYADFRSAETAIDYDSMDPADALERLIAISFDTHRANPHVIRIIMSENLDQGSHLAADDQTVQRAKVLDVTRRILERGIASGVFAPDVNPLHLHMSLSALCFHFHSNRYTFGTIFAVDYENPAFVEERRTEVIRTLMKRCLK